MSDGGKGSAPRPISDWERFEKHWNEIFGEPKKKKSSVPTTGTGVFVVDSEGVCDKEKTDRGKPWTG